MMDYYVSWDVCLSVSLCILCDITQNIYFRYLKHNESHFYDMQKSLSIIKFILFDYDNVCHSHCKPSILAS